MFGRREANGHLRWTRSLMDSRWASNGRPVVCEAFEDTRGPTRRTVGDGARSRIELSGSVGGSATDLTQGQAESAIWQQNVTAETSPEDRPDRNQVRLRAEFWSERS